MHTPVRAFLLVVLTAAAACSLGPTAPSDRPVGTFEGRWDDASWRGRAHAVLRWDTLFLTAHRPDAKYFYDEYIHAKVPFTGAGTYTIRGHAGQLARITGGDAGYFPDAEGTLVVSSWDAGARTVAGELRLHAESVRPSWRAEGRFHAPVYADFSEVPPPPRR